MFYGNCAFFVGVMVLFTAPAINADIAKVKKQEHHNRTYSLKDYYFKLKHLKNNNDMHHTQEIIIPIIIHIDQLLIEKYKTYTKNRKEAKNILESYIRNVSDEIKESFSHPSLGKRVKIEVEDIRFLKDLSSLKEVNLPSLTNPYSSNLLTLYCKWQGLRKKKTKKMWYSILLTGLDMFYYNKKGRKIFENKARSYRNGQCNVERSCAVAEGGSDTLVLNLTHEIGHSLGIHHDGDENNCPKKGYIMAPKTSKGAVVTTWSACSANYLHQYLQSKMSKCLKRI